MINRLPCWFKQEIPDEEVLDLSRRLRNNRLNTVCRSAHCPNINSCFKQRQVTFMILGDKCSRHCRFCAVDKQNDTALSLNREEPQKIAKLIKELGIRYVVITSVTRDDLADGGAGEFARCINLIREFSPDVKIEILIPDFSGNADSLKKVIAARPSVIAHNLETVRHLYPQLKPDSDYLRSLRLLSLLKKIGQSLVTKSSLMLGLGEAESDILAAMCDLRDAGCDILTLGQYLAPTRTHYPVKEFVTVEKFARLGEKAYSSGFKAVLSGPKVRSSYHADKLYEELKTCTT